MQLFEDVTGSVFEPQCCYCNAQTVRVYVNSNFLCFFMFALSALSHSGEMASGLQRSVATFWRSSNPTCDDHGKILIS